MSQTLLVHTADAAGAVQVPSSVGWWPGSVGMGEPLASLATQADALHHLSVGQSLSAAQAPASMHIPVTEQVPDRHTTDALPDVHVPPPLA